MQAKLLIIIGCLVCLGLPSTESIARRRRYRDYDRYDNDYYYRRRHSRGGKIAAGTFLGGAFGAAIGGAAGGRYGALGGFLGGSAIGAGVSAAATRDADYYYNDYYEPVYEEPVYVYEKPRKYVVPQYEPEEYKSEDEYVPDNE